MVLMEVVMFVMTIFLVWLLIFRINGLEITVYVEVTARIAIRIGVKKAIVIMA
jgi:hypothetical protein